MRKAAEPSSNLPPSIFPKDDKLQAWPIRAPGKQHLFRYGAALVSGKAARLGEWLQHLQGFMADSQMTEVLMFFTQKFAQLEGPVNFTLSTLTDLAWTILVLVWESALEGRLPFLKEVEKKLHESYVQLQAQFFECRKAWLAEISETRDKIRDRMISPGVQEAFHRSMEEDIQHFIPQEALESEQAEYFIASVKEGVKHILSRVGGREGCKDRGVQTKGPRPDTPTQHPESEEEMPDEIRRFRDASKINLPQLRQDYEKRLKEAQRDKEALASKLEQQVEDDEARRKEIEKMKQLLKQAAMEKEALQAECDQLTANLEKKRYSGAPPLGDMDAIRQQNKEQLERRVWTSEKKLHEAQTQIADLQAALAAAPPQLHAPSKTNEDLKNRISELEEELRKLKDERAELHENFLHMMEEHEHHLLESIGKDIIPEGRLSRSSTFSRKKSVDRSATSGRLGRSERSRQPTTSKPGSSEGARAKPPPRTDLIPLGVTVETGVGAMAQDSPPGGDEKHKRSASIGLTAGENEELLPPPTTPRSSLEVDASKRQSFPKSRDDDRASRWMEEGPSTPEARRRGRPRSKAGDEASSASGASASGSVQHHSPTTRKKRRRRKASSPTASDGSPSHEQEGDAGDTADAVSSPRLKPKDSGFRLQPDEAVAAKTTTAAAAAADNGPLRPKSTETTTSGGEQPGRAEEQGGDAPPPSDQTPGGRRTISPEGEFWRQASRESEAMSVDTEGLSRTALPTTPDAPGYGLLAAMRHEVKQRRTGFVARLKAMYGKHMDGEEGVEEDGMTPESSSFHEHDEETQTFEDELDRMPLVGNQRAGGGFVGGASLRGSLGGRAERASLQDLREKLAQERQLRQKADVTLTELSAKMIQLKELLKKRGVTDEILKEAVGDLGLDGMVSSPRGCREVFKRLHQDAIDRAERLLARQKEAFDRLQKQMELDATFRMLIGLPDGSEDGSMSKAAMAMRKTVEAFSVLGQSSWRDPLESEPSISKSDFSSIAWITDPQVLPFLEKEWEVSGLGPPLTVTRSTSLSETIRGGGGGGKLDLQHRDAQGWPRLPDSKTNAPSLSSVAGKQTSTSSLAQASTQQLDDALSSVGSMSLFEADSVLRQSSVMSASSNTWPERKLVRNKQRLRLASAQAEMTFEEFCSRHAAGQDEQLSRRPNSRRVLLSSLVQQQGGSADTPASMESDSRPGTAQPSANFDLNAERPQTVALPFVGDTLKQGGSGDGLWRTKSQPVVRCTSRHGGGQGASNWAGQRPAVRIRGSKR